MVIDFDHSFDTNSSYFDRRSLWGFLNKVVSFCCSFREGLILSDNAVLVETEDVILSLPG